MSDTPKPNSGGAKAIIPLVILAVIVAVGWMIIQKPEGASTAVTPVSDVMVPADQSAVGNEMAPANLNPDAPAPAAVETSGTEPAVTPELGTIVDGATGTAEGAVEGAVDAVTETAGDAATATGDAVEPAADAASDAVDAAVEAVAPEAPVEPTPTPAPAQ